MMATRRNVSNCRKKPEPRLSRERSSVAVAPNASVLNEWLARVKYGHDPEAAKIATLTPRERDVIALVSEGHKNRDIATRLRITEATVRHHLTAIFAKLEVPDRVGLVLYAYRYGLIKLPE